VDARTIAPPDAIPVGTIARKPRGRFTLTPINLRRWQNFKANKRGYWSLLFLQVLFVC
jgi:hypothetical protein